MGEKVIGRIDGGRFVPIAKAEGPGMYDGDDPHEPEGYVSSERIEAAVAERLAATDALAARERASEQLDTLAHVVASIDSGALSLEQLDKLGSVAQSVVELWRDGVRAEANGARA